MLPWQEAASNPWPPAAWDPAAQPPSLLIGVLSSDVRLAVRALKDCARALGVPFEMPTSRVRAATASACSASVPDAFLETDVRCRPGSMSAAQHSQ